MYGGPIPEGPGYKAKPRDMDRLKYTLQRGKIIKALHAYRNLELPSSDITLHPLSPGDWVYLTTGKAGNPQDQLDPKWTGPYLVILTTHSV